MKRWMITTAVLGVVVAAVAGIRTVAGAGGGPPETREGPEALRDPSVPAVPLDLGTGERLLLVVAGVFPTEAEAEAANRGFAFGELQGFYALPMDQFEGLRTALRDVGAESGDWVLASAFRTEAAAKQFAVVARIAGAPAFVTSRVTNLGGAYAGLGQEAAPDGRGPLTHEIPASRAT